MAGGVLGRLADVDQHRLLAIDEAHRIGGADTFAPPMPSASVGQSSRPPETSAVAKRYQLSRTKLKVARALEPDPAKREL